MYKNYTNLKDDFAIDLLLTISKSDSLEYTDEVRIHLRHLLMAGVLSLDFIENNLNESNMNRDWCWKTVSFSPNLTLDFLKKHVDKSWDWKAISKNNIINNNFVDKYPDKSYCWFSLTQNRSITISEDFVRKYCYKNLDWKLLSSHEDISLDFISDLRLDVAGSSTRPKWHSWEISKRKDLTMAFITKYKDCNFNWNAIVKNENLPLESLINLLENLGKIQWGFWYYLSLRNDISEDIIEKYPLKRWNWWWISKNKNINIDIVKRHPNWNWDWAYLPVNPNITLQIIKDNPEFPWNLKNITSNLTNKMINEWTDKNRNKYISARRIHRFWRDVNYNPCYKRARNNLLKNLEVSTD